MIPSSIEMRGFTAPQLGGLPSQHCWIVCQDYGSEGKAEPFFVFQDETEAREFHRRLCALNASFIGKVIEAEYVRRRA